MSDLEVIETVTMSGKSSQHSNQKKVSLRVLSTITENNDINTNYIPLLIILVPKKEH
jgi:hypothetical protein